MGVFTYETGTTSTVPLAKLFEALVHDADFILLKVVDSIKTFTIVERIGGPGTVNKVTFDEGGQTLYILHKIDVLDDEKLEYNYSIVGGFRISEIVDEISFETILVKGPNWGSIGKMFVKYHTKEDAKPVEKEVEEGKAKADALFKAVVHDADIILPKIVGSIKTFEIVEGNGGPGTIKKFTFVEGGKTLYGLNKIEAIDDAKLEFSYRVGGLGLSGIVDKISFKAKLVEGPNGGSFGKMSVKYHSKGDAKPVEKEVEEGKAKGDALFKAIEGFVLRNSNFGQSQLQRMLYIISVLCYLALLVFSN